MSDQPSQPGSAAEADGSAAPIGAQRVELILQQLEALPTLDAVAVRIIELTSADDAKASEVIDLISVDPALSSRVLKLSRSAARKTSKAITTVDRAVLHLGFEAVRSAVLSVGIFDLFKQLEDANSDGGGDGVDLSFDRTAFWHHSLAVAVLCESLVESTNLKSHVSRGEAFLAGLLHDLGVLALHVLLPKSIDRVCRIADANGVSIDQACSRVIGMTSHTTGKRLAERWHLPRSLGDVLWLHGQRFESLPDLPHRGLIALVTLADAVARGAYITYIGHGGRGEDIVHMCDTLDLDPERVHQAIEHLHDNVAARAAVLGMDSKPDWDMVLRCITRANQSLGRINASLRRQAALAEHQGKILQAIMRFQDAQEPGDTLVTVLERVNQSAIGYLGNGFYAMLLQSRPASSTPSDADAVDDSSWQLIQFTNDGLIERSESIEPPPGSVSLSDLDDSSHVSMQMLGILPWLSDYLVDAGDLREVRLLPLRSGWGVSAVLLHDRPIPDAGTGTARSGGREGAELIESLSRTWAAAIAAAGQHEGARNLGEQLAEANRMLVEAQEELARRKAMVCVGEIVGGAAHEMNNPLTVISGRSQQLLYKLKDSELHEAAEQIAQQSHRLSDMISALREFTEPAKPDRRTVDLANLVVRVAGQIQPRRRGGAGGSAGAGDVGIDTIVSDNLPPAFIDPDQIALALSELLQNAVESKGSKHVELRVQIDRPDDRLRIQVRDDGMGLSAHALAHAFDPFYSSKPAGRQPGLGLARARRYVEAHEGRLTLTNVPQGGAIATIVLEDWRADGKRSKVRRKIGGTSGDKAAA